MSPRIHWVYNPDMPHAKSIWKGITLGGLGVFTAAEFALVLAFRGYEIFAGHIRQILMAFPAGLLVLLVGLIGWATQIGRRGRLLLAALALAPLPLLWIAVAIFSKIHIQSNVGLYLLASGPLFAAVLPLFVTGLILGIMALASRRA